MTLTTLIVMAGVVALAGFAQGAAGIGFALITAPVLGFLRPDLMPTTLLMLMIPLNFYVAWREWRGIDRIGAGWVTLGRIVGTFGGIWILAVLPQSALNVLIGGSTVLAAIVSMAAPVFAPGHKTFIAAGLVTGVTETATGVGGPPLALVYQHHQPQVLRATIATCFLAGEILSVIFLAAAGKVTSDQTEAALIFLPAIALGLAVSHHVHRKLDAKLLRKIVLTFALVSGAVLLFR